MKFLKTVGILLGLLAHVLGFPFPQNFEEAVRQAQQMSLIPTGAVVEKTMPALQVAYFKLGENDKFNQEDLRTVLEGIPPEVVASLESQVAKVGLNDN